MPRMRPPDEPGLFATLQAIRASAILQSTTDMRRFTRVELVNDKKQVCLWCKYPIEADKVVCSHCGGHA